LRVKTNECVIPVLVSVMIAFVVPVGVPGLPPPPGLLALLPPPHPAVQTSKAQVSMATDVLLQC